MHGSLRSLDPFAPWSVPQSLWAELLGYFGSIPFCAAQFGRPVTLNYFAIPPAVRRATPVKTASICDKQSAATKPRSSSRNLDSTPALGLGPLGFFASLPTDHIVDYGRAIVPLEGSVLAPPASSQTPLGRSCTADWPACGGIELVVLALSLFQTFRRADVGLYPQLPQTSVKHVAQRPSFVDRIDFFCQLQLFLGKEQQLLKAQALYRLDPSIVLLPCHLIARQMRVDAKKDLLGLWLLLVVAFTHLFGECR